MRFGFVVLCLALALALVGIHQAFGYVDGKRPCSTACKERVKKRELREARAQKKRRLAREWRYWSRQPIPTCTWYGESGPGLPQFHPRRYTIPNSQGSGAYGKYQMMPGTYFAFAKYGDWSMLDQEIAAHRLYWAQGTSPWSAC